MSRDMTRADFLRGGFLRSVRKNNEKRGPRPPWAREGDDFSTACTRCGLCVTACPEGILVMRSDSAKTAKAPPFVDFSHGYCTFCGRCIEVCAPGALARFTSDTPPRMRPPWDLKAKISADCLVIRGTACRVCADPCPTRAIVFTPHTKGHVFPEIDTRQCTGCGACYASCPVSAISIS